MSDYFGALLRSAGALSAAAAPVRAAGDDIAEQDLELEAVAPAEATAMAAAPAPEPAAEADGQEVAAPAPLAHRAPPQAPASPAAAPDARVEVLPGAAWAQPEESALPHPMVQAALRWVAADAQAAAPPVQATKPAPGELAPRQGPAAHRPIDPGPAAFPQDPAMQRAPERRVEPSRRLQTAREIDVALPLPPRPRAAPALGETRASPSRAIDVHIGTIHVAVDAPPPRVLAQPVLPPAPVPPPAPRAAERGGFARLRLPRL